MFCLMRRVFVSEKAPKDCFHGAAIMEQTLPGEVKKSDWQFNSWTTNHSKTLVREGSRVALLIPAEVALPVPHCQSHVWSMGASAVR